MSNLKFLQDIFYNLDAKKYYSYTFTGKTENENKIALGLLFGLSCLFTYIATLTITFNTRLPILFLVFYIGICAFSIYSKFNNSDDFKNNFFKHLEFREKLFELIEYNSFYKRGQIHGTDAITYSTKVYYRFLKNGFEIKIRLDGSIHQERYTELENKLYHLFGYRIIDVIMENGSYTYIFTYNDLKPFFINETLHGQKYFRCSEEEIFFSDDLIWNFRKQSHGLVTGVTGGGKTYVLFWIIRNLVACGSELKILDPKRDNLDYLRNILGDNDVASSKGNIIRILRESSLIINNRNIEFQTRSDYKQGKDYLDYGYKPIFIVFDEVTAFFASCESKESKEANGYLQEIIMKGRSAGIFMILTTQRADADVINGKIRDQLGLRVAMGGLSPDGNVMTFGNEYRDLKLSIRGVIRGKPRSGVGYIHIDGLTSKPQEFYSPVFECNYDFFKDIELLKSF